MADSAKVEMSVASQPSHHFPLTAPHLTTTNLFSPLPVAVIELAPKSHGTIRVKSFFRANAVAQPMLGQVAIHNRFFFVRNASLWRPFYDFIADTPHVTSSTPSLDSTVPYLSSYDLASMLSNSQYSSTQGPNPDFYLGSQGYTLSPLGRYLRSVLHSLGYVVRSHAQGDEGVFWSAVPLLALGRVLIDWYYPSQYVAITNTYYDVMALFERQGAFQLTVANIESILDLLDYVMFDDDMFINAWDNPVSPNSGASSSFSMQDATASNYLSVNTLADGTPYVRQGAPSNLATVTANSISLMTQLSLYMRSHQLSGARALDRWLLDFGLSIRSDKLNRSYYLGADDAPMQFGIVESNADTSGAALGDYAGKGAGYVQGKAHKFDTLEDHGFLLCINTLVPKTGIFQGVKRHVRHLNKLDFFNPRFDGIGVQAIGASEVYNSCEANGFNTGIDNKIFGFTKRYAEYKDLLPTVSGDFIDNSVNLNLDQWHMFRILNDAYFANSNANVIHDPHFISGGFHRDEFLRFLATVNPKLGDAFKCMHWIELDMDAEMLPLYDDYLFKEFDDEHKKKVKVDVNGVNVN